MTEVESSYRKALLDRRRILLEQPGYYIFEVFRMLLGYIIGHRDLIVNILKP